MCVKNRYWKPQPNIRDANDLIHKKVPDYCMSPIIIHIDMSYK